MAEPFFKSAELGAEASVESRIGDSLRYEREKRGLTVQHVAQHLCLSRSIIERLEAGDADALPDPVYVRGYVRAYCRLLGIDSAPLLDEFVPKFTRREEDDFLPAMNEHIHRMTRLWGTFTVLAVVILLVSFWWMERPDVTARLPTADPPLEPAPTQTPATFIPPAVESSSFPNPASDPASPGEPVLPADVGDKVEIAIQSSQRSWTQLSDGTGALLIDRILPPGYNATVQGEFPLDFKFGDARGMRVWINGLEYDIKPHLGRLNTAFFTLEEPLQ